MDFSVINWLAVIVCVIVSMISGALWYNPIDLVDSRRFQFGVQLDF